MPHNRIQLQARAILTHSARPSASLASLALLALKHPRGLPALRMVSTADGSARYVPARAASVARGAR